MKISLRLYEIFRNGNWELFCIAKNFVYNDKTWLDDCEKIHDLTMEEILVFGLIKYVKAMIEDRLNQTEECIVEFCEKHDTGIKSDDLILILKEYRNDYNEDIYSVFDDSVFFDKEARFESFDHCDQPNDVDCFECGKDCDIVIDQDKLFKHKKKIVKKFLSRLPITCHDGCPVGLMTFKKAMEPWDVHEQQDRWNYNKKTIDEQKNCKCNVNGICKHPKNFMRERMKEKRWQYVA